MSGKRDLLKDLHEATKSVESSLRADVFLVSGKMSPAVHAAFVEQSQKKKQENVIVILSTYGGNPDVAYKIGRRLRRLYKKIYIGVPAYCKSAGTLLALAADELVIWDDGELGPLDAQVHKPDELGEFGSSLAIMQAFDALNEKIRETFRDHLLDVRMGGRMSTKICVSIATELTARLFAPIYEQIDVSRLGEISRSIHLGLEYGRRLKSANLQSPSGKFGFMLRALRPAAAA